MRISDWSSDVCSSDLKAKPPRTTDCLPHRRPTTAPTSWRSISSGRSEPHPEGNGQLRADRRTGHRLLGRADSAIHPQFPYRGGAHAASARPCARAGEAVRCTGERPQRRRSEEHTSELQSLMRTSYAVFCLKKKKYTRLNTNTYILLA